MITFEELVPIVASRLGKGPRFNHTMMVVETAVKLADIHGCDVEKVKIAAILHDITKHETLEYHRNKINSYFGADVSEKWPKPIWHALSAVVVAHDELHIEDADILAAIQYHTSGRPAMSVLEKIIYVADFIEPTRTFDNREFYNTAMVDLDKSVAMILQSLNDYLISQGEVPVQDGANALRYYQHHLEE